MEIEKQYEWNKKSKKYKTKYFNELGRLYREATNDTEGQERAQGRSRADHAGHLDEEIRS